MQKYRKAGMNAFLQKPFSEKALLNSILSVTGHSQAAPAEGEDRLSAAGTEGEALKGCSTGEHAGRGCSTYQRRRSSAVNGAGRRNTEEPDRSG